MKARESFGQLVPGQAIRMSAAPFPNSYRSTFPSQNHAPDWPPHNEDGRHTGVVTASRSAYYPASIQDEPTIGVTQPFANEPDGLGLDETSTYFDGDDQTFADGPLDDVHSSDHATLVGPDAFDSNFGQAHQNAEMPRDFSDAEMKAFLFCER